MVKQHHRLDGHEFEHTVGDSEGQGSLACCISWGLRVAYDLATEQKSNMTSDIMTSAKTLSTNQVTFSSFAWTEILWGQNLVYCIIQPIFVNWNY